MLLISKTYEVVTQESAENGEAEETGFSWEDMEHTVSEAVEILKGLEPSQISL